MDMFSPEEDVSLPLVEEPIGLRTEAQSYEDIVKDFIFEETQYMRDLSQIIKVFRAPFVRHFPTSKVGVQRKQRTETLVPGSINWVYSLLEFQISLKFSCSFHNQANFEYTYWPHLQFI